MAEFAVRSVLEVRDGLRSVTVIRVGVRSYVVAVQKSEKVQYRLGPVGVPCTRIAAIDHGLELAEQLGLLPAVVRERSRRRRQLRRAEERARG